MIFATRLSALRRRKKTYPNLRVESLEPRMLLACNVISGFVYNDANNNGLFDAGETPIANSTIELRNASGVVVGQTTTDAFGAYRFETDRTIDTSPLTIEQELIFDPPGDSFMVSQDVNQFNPDLGTLTSVEIVSVGSIQGQIRSESLENEPVVITANINGTLTLTAPGVGITAAQIDESRTFDATAYDGVTDFAGTSGIDFGSIIENNTETATLTSATDLAAYTGTGTVTIGLTGLVNTSGTGAANLANRRSATAGATVTVTYRYTPTNCLSPGAYTIVQTTQPPGFTDGRESSGGVVIPGSDTTDVIPVVLGDVDLPNNNFGEVTIVTPIPPTPIPPTPIPPTPIPPTPIPPTPIPPTPIPPDRLPEVVVPPSSLAGFVYFDANNNGIFESREFGIANVTVTLNGTNDLGNSVILVTMTAADGSYSFTNLRPGLYMITETQPTAFITGKDTIGTLGGNTSRNEFSTITVPAGVAGVQYNFGELARKACKLNHFNFNAARGRRLPARPGPKMRFFLPGMINASGQGGSQRARPSRS